MPALLREWYAISPEDVILNEDAQPGAGKLQMRCIMQRCETPNQNKRVYPRKILAREFENYQKAVRESRATGELDHPETSTVSLEKVAHIVREMWWEENKWMGKVEILPTPMGRIAEQLIRSGVTLGISSRGVGSTSKNEGGNDMVQDDFTLVAFDLVAEPSTPGAYLHEGVLKEAARPTLSRADRINRALNALKGR